MPFVYNFADQIGSTIERPHQMHNAEGATTQFLEEFVMVFWVPPALLEKPRPTNNCFARAGISKGQRGVSIVCSAWRHNFEFVH
mmetsp:Transcript_74515/g.200150  ORF Transcript_74515/g.200150 Transcript_74515/m.200150 type:complete len:84 (-) Transcript_74515:76-327(-)